MRVARARVRRVVERSRQGGQFLGQRVPTLVTFALGSGSSGVVVGRGVAVVEEVSGMRSGRERRRSW